MNLADLRVEDVVRAVRGSAWAEQAPALAPARMRPLVPALPDAYRYLTTLECRERLRLQRDEALQRASNQRWSNAESKEWAALSREHRMCLHLLAGIDGDLPQLALREWRELPDPERAAIKAEVRAMRSAMGSVFSLSGNW